MLTLEIRRSAERGVRHRGRHIQEERLPFARVIQDETYRAQALRRSHRIHVDPVTRVTHQMSVHVTRQFRISLAAAFIAQRVAARPHVIGVRRDHGFIEPMSRRQEARSVAEVPLADDAGMVAGLLEQRAQRLLIVTEADLGIRAEGRAAETETIGITSGHQSDARRRADRLGGEEVGEAQSVLAQLVDVGRGVLLRTIAAGISPTHVIAHDQDNVRPAGEQGCTPEQKQGWGKPHGFTLGDLP